MNAATSRRGVARGQLEPATASRGVWPVSSTRGGAALAAAFTAAALRYWGIVFPEVRRELARRRARAERIADPALQRLALAALGKRANVEGATAFAAFVPRASRAAAIRALAAFQLAYDYVDLLAEQPCRDPVANARRLHSALLHALDPGAAHPDYYEHFLGRADGDHHERLPRRADGGYLQELLNGCREALAELPSHAAVLAPARRAAARIVAFQSLSLGGRAGADMGAGGHRDGLEALRRCACEQTPPGSGLRWWETAAAGGSSLGALALIAAAAEPDLDPRELAALEDAYFPWIGACHSLLDSLVDREEDARIGQLSLIGFYAGTDDAAARMGALAARSMRHARELPAGRAHAVLFAAMAGFYLSDPKAAAPDLLPVGRAVRRALGPLARPTLRVFALRRRWGISYRPGGS